MLPVALLLGCAVSLPPKPCCCVVDCGECQQLVWQSMYPAGALVPLHGALAAVPSSYAMSG
jgi:hypothetical protein